MEVQQRKNSPRVGPSNGESHTPTSAGGRPEYTGGPKFALEEKENRIDDDNGKVLMDDEILDDLALTTASEGEGGSRAATPVSAGSKFFRTRGGISDESGNETAVSQKNEEEMERTRRRFRKRRGSEVEEEDSEKEKGVNASKSIKRGRGRPPTTGQYVGLHQAKKDKQAEERKAEQAEAERQILEMAERLPQLRSHRLSEASSDVTMESEEEEVTSAKLSSTITSSLGVITKVATTSKNLSGGYVKSLKNATKAIQEACAALLQRSSSTETKALETANKRLSKEVQELKNELAVVKRELISAQPRVAPATPSLEEMLEKAVREAISISSARLDARLECLEARLLPEPRLRPPLAADKKREEVRDTRAPVSKTKQKTGEPDPSVATLSSPLNPGLAQKKKKKERKSAAAVEAAAARRDVATTPAAARPLTEEWTEVVKKRGKVQKKGDERKKVPKKRKGKSNRLRDPKTSAVVITLHPDAEKRGVSYKDVLARAKQRVDLAALDIPAVKFKVAVTGARMLEIPGAASRAKADKLAEKLKEVMEEGDVRISRPQKCAELRIQGLDDSATPAEIAQAIATPGGCAAGDIKVGEIKRDRRGRGTAWIKCPVEAAKRVTAPNIKVYVGWTVVRVVLLPMRPMRCYKCHETGHTRATCPNEADRSELCFRCGQPGHPSSQCQNAPHCALCASSGKTADHSVGSKSCGKPASRGRSSKKSKAPQKPATLSTVGTGTREATMEAQ